MSAAAGLRPLEGGLRDGITIMEEKMDIISNPRDVRAAWGELADALLLGVHAMFDGELSHADRTLLVVKAMKLWPQNAIVTMVDRVLALEEAASGDALLAALGDRDPGERLVDTLFRPVLFASTIREFSPAEVRRLVEAVRAAGIDPAVFGLPV